MPAQQSFAIVAAASTTTCTFGVASAALYVMNKMHCTLVTPANTAACDLIEVAAVLAGISMLNESKSAVGFDGNIISTKLEILLLLVTLLVSVPVIVNARLTVRAIFFCD